MKLIEKISEDIDEELCDARKYIECALEIKEEHPQTARVFYDLAEQEIQHADRLHATVVELINEYKVKNGDPPESMRIVYEYLHKKQIHNMDSVKVLIGLY